MLVVNLIKVFDVCGYILIVLFEMILNDFKWKCFIIFIIDFSYFLYLIFIDV